MRKTPIGLEQAARLTILCVATMLLVVAPLSSPWAGTAQTAKAECLKQLGLSSDGMYLYRGPVGVGS